MKKHGRRADAARPCTLIAMVLFWLASLTQSCWAEGGVRALSLDEAYDLALKSQEQIQIARVEVGKSNLLPKKAMSMMMPRATVSGTYTRLNDTIDFPFELQTGAGTIDLGTVETVPEDQTTGNFEFVQPIYVGQFWPTRKKAKEAVESSREAYKQTIQEVLFKVAQVYYEVLKRERLVQNARETLSLAEEELRASQVKFKAGAVTEDVVLRSQLEVSRAESTVVKTLNSLKLAKDVLRRLTGIQEQDVRVNEPLGLAEEAAGYDELVRLALQDRYDYRQAALAVKMAESDVELVYSKFHPRLGASWNYFEVSDPAWNQEENYWVAVVKLEFPLFEGGQRYYELKEKRESLRQAKLSLDDLKQNIQVDLRDALLALETQKALVENSASQVKLAESNYQIVFSKFQYGAATFSDMAEARVYLDTSKTNLITNSVDREMSILNVQRAVGRLVRDHIEKVEEGDEDAREWKGRKVFTDWDIEKGSHVYD